MSKFYLLQCCLLLSVIGLWVRADDEVASPEIGMLLTTANPPRDDATLLPQLVVSEEATLAPTDAPRTDTQEDAIADGSTTPTLHTTTTTTSSEASQANPELNERHATTSTTSSVPSSTTGTAATTHETTQDSNNHHQEGDYSPAGVSTTQHHQQHHDQHHQQQHHPEQHIVHGCTTQNPCIDPKSHCVRTEQGNRCVCLLGYSMNDTSGVCQLETTTTSTSTTTSTTTTSSPVTSNAANQAETFRADKRSDTEDAPATTQQQTSTTPTKPPHKRRYAMVASNLSAEENKAVVSLILRPYTTVVQWLMENDLRFRTVISEIISSTNFTVRGENGSMLDISTNVTADDVIYVSPSPQIFADGLLVSFIVHDPTGTSSKEYLVKQGIINRQKRNPSSTSSADGWVPQNEDVYFPASWIIPAVCANQTLVESLLGQNISSIYAGISSDLLSIERLASASLFQRRIDIFVPVIILLALVCIACTLSVVCVRAKARSSATWDPPAGLVYSKGNGRNGNRNSVGDGESGQDLASDSQCREGETDSISKQVITISDDDVWVVPYNEPQGPKPQLWTEVQDTKL